MDKGAFETGFEVQHRKFDNDFNSNALMRASRFCDRSKQSATDLYIQDQIHAGYLIIAGKKSNLNMEFGLRGGYTK